MPILTVRHVTTYRYKQPVAFGEHRMMFRPRDSYDQRLIEAALDIVPEPAELRWMHDVFGNCVAIARFGRRAPGAALRQHASGSIIRRSTRSISGSRSMRRHYPFTYGAEEMPDLLRSIERQYLDPDHELDRWARQFPAPATARPTRMSCWLR